MYDESSRVILKILNTGHKLYKNLRYSCNRSKGKCLNFHRRRNLWVEVYEVDERSG